MIYFSLLYMVVWYMQATFRLNPRCWCACVLWVLLLLPAGSHSKTTPRKKGFSASVKIVFNDTKTGESKSEQINGRFGLSSPMESKSGIVVHIRSRPPNSNVTNQGCHPSFENEIPSEQWVALVERGNCKFTEKIKNVEKYNASAVLIYNKPGLESLISMKHEARDIEAVFIKRSSGIRIATLVDAGVRVVVQIDKGPASPGSRYSKRSGIRSSVLIVAITLPVLLIITLAWFLIYYIRWRRFPCAK